MGWASRAREAREREGVKTFTVKQWTAFEWSYPEGKGKAITERRRELRKDRVDHLKRSADTIERELRRRFADHAPKVKQVKVAREPQLLFELTVRAVDEHGARRHALYLIKRGLSVRLPSGRMVPMRDKRGANTGAMKPERVQLRPPMGEVVAEEKLPSRSKAKVST